MQVAKDAAQLSYAERLKVGAVVVKDRNILAFGYNGTLPGKDNVCEHLVDGKLVTKDSVLHAEENAIIKMAKSSGSTDKATMYITHQPCIKCARMIVAAGFSRLVYDESYRDSSGIDLLHESNLSVEKFN
jgi:dCMP deaminase